MGANVKDVSIIQIHDDGALFWENASEDRNKQMIGC